MPRTLTSHNPKSNRGFYALLGSSIGAKVARLIIDHRVDMKRIVRRILLIRGDGEDEDASVDVCIILTGRTVQ